MSLSKRYILGLLLLLAASAAELMLYSPAPVFAAGSTFVVNTMADGSDNSPGDGICDNGGGQCTLRAAIQEANATVDLDTINFSIGTGAQTLQYAELLPEIISPVSINGTTQPGYTDKPIIVVNGSLVTTPADPFERHGLVISAGGSTVKGLAIVQFGGTGIYLKDQGNNTIQGNFIGINAAGTAAAGNGSDGIQIYGSPNNQIGGLNMADRNVISGNGGDGIDISNSSNTIIRGNIIGLNAAGSAAVANNQMGIRVGTFGSSSDGTIIGGTETGARNLISGNKLQGIQIAASLETTDNSVIQGNFIGTDITGKLDRGNGDDGIYLYNANNTMIGGTAAGAGNVISGNDGDGIVLSVGDAITIQGNIIGANNDGNAPLGNQGDGINLFNSPTNILIGGTTSGAGNIVSGNNGNGIILFEISNVTIYGNYIGTNPLFGAVGNLKAGIYVDQNSDSATIGGTNTNEANAIAFNNAPGIQVYGKANAIRGNYIFGNTDVGIDLRIPGVQNVLSSPGVTPNDSLDGDNGGNNLQNYPVLTSAAVSGGNITISGGLSSSVATAFKVDFYSNVACDASGNGEGLYYLGTVDVTTDNNGNASFTATFAAPAETSITALATDSGNNTSEFSACIQANAGTPTETATATPSETVVPTVTATATATDVPPPTEFQWLAPTGVVSNTTGNPAFQWPHLNGVTRYQLYVGSGTVGSGLGTIFYQEMDSATYCTTNICSAVLTDINPVAWLYNGQFTVFIKPGDMGWSGPHEFTVNVSSPTTIVPGQTTNVETNTPTLHWTLEGAGASSAFFQVYIAPTDDLINAAYFNWVARNEVCGSWEGVTCSFQLPVALPTNTHFSAFIQSWGPGGFSVGGSLDVGWEVIEFNMGGPLPLLPSGIQASVTGNQPIIAWNDDPNATRWSVWAGDISNISGAYYQLHDKAEGICNGTTCTLTPKFSFAPGQYSIYMQAEGPHGRSRGGIANLGWAGGTTFTIP